MLGGKVNDQTVVEVAQKRRSSRHGLENAGLPFLA